VEDLEPEEEFSIHFRLPNKTDKSLKKTGVSYLFLDKMPIDLVSADGLTVPVEWKVLKQMTMVKDKLDDMGMDQNDNELFPVDVISVVLKMVIKWATHHKDDPTPEDDDAAQRKAESRMSKWDKAFLDEFKDDPGTLFELLLASKHLEVKKLTDQICKRCQELIKGKTTEQLRSTFKITGDFTKEEENQIRMENEWCMEAK